MPRLIHLLALVPWLLLKFVGFEARSNLAVQSLWNGQYFGICGPQAARAQLSSLLTQPYRAPTPYDVRPAAARSVQHECERLRPWSSCVLEKSSEKKKKREKKLYMFAVEVSQTYHFTGTPSSISYQKKSKKTKEKKMKRKTKENQGKTRGK